MGDTPRTDNAVFEVGGRFVGIDGRFLDPMRYFVEADFARQLERELVAERKVWKGALQKYGGHLSYCNAELRLGLAPYVCQCGFTAALDTAKEGE